MTPHTEDQPQAATIWRKSKLFWLALRYGFKLGFTWVHCNGESSHASAVLASYHHPLSITWRWALYWNRPAGIGKFSFSRWRPPNSETGSLSIGIPFIGGLSLNWQAHLWR